MLIVLKGFAQRVHLHSLRTCTHRVLGGALPLFSDPEVMRQRGYQLTPLLRIELFEHLARAAVKLFAASEQQQVVGCLLSESMLEDVLKLGVASPLAHQLLVAQGVKMRLGILNALIGRRLSANCRQRALCEYPAEDRGSLCHPLRVARQTINARA